ncbi:glyoxalase superfamily protein [Devosia submarina]|uniref:glyoxalase superfamily protein n=1 Tax=Devosia submarina TaxID=1173082 RepID=UPI000D369AAD|nr:glyoxalase superfamily protein [Devosia submarina]
MSFSLDTQSVQTLKSEAKALREQRSAAGETLTHSEALEAIAKAHGFRDWNTARASLPDGVVAPFQLGQHVHGTYLDQPFRGVLIGVQMLGAGQHFKLTIQFDEPVNVTPTFMFAAFRHRVVATVDPQGVSPALRGNGRPQTIVRRG